MTVALATPDARPVHMRTDLWRLHPQGDFLMAAGGDRMPPPAYVNMVLTNKCNLRCEICGSQKYLDHTKTTRSHMPLDIFLRTAETVFPVASEVELNSQGDPLLYPDIGIVLDKVAEHRCEIRLQTNGTLFSDAVSERLLAMHGTVYMSIDAVGPKFDKVRRNGVWDRAEPGIARLLDRRDPTQLGIRLYPTITARTVDGMLDVVRWAADHGVDSVEFHNYNPIEMSFEREPDPDALRASTDAIQDWLATHSTITGVVINSVPLNPTTHRRTKRACAIKGRFVNGDPLYPLDEGHPWAATRSLCMAPFRQLDIGLVGEVSACCRAQDVALGTVTSVEAFAKLWFGHNYTVLRQSLTRGDAGPLPLPNCVPCIKYHAPEAGAAAVGIDYSGNPDHPRALRIDRPEVPLVLVVRAGPNGKRFTGRIPPGLDPRLYRLHEDERPMNPMPAGDAVLEAGDYMILGNTIHFVGLDPEDPVRNRRRYHLKRLD